MPKRKAAAKKSPLEEAVENGDLKTVQRIINTQGIKSVNSCKLLCVAVKWDWTEIACFLIERGADVNSKIECADNPLHFAIANGNLFLVRLLMNKNASVNAFNADKETPLHTAVEICDKSLVQQLLSKGARSFPDKSHFEPLHIACFNRSRNIMELLLTAEPQLLMNPESLTLALLIAAQNGSKEIVSLLLRAGANPNSCLKSALKRHHKFPFSEKYGSTALHRACQGGHLNIVELLLKKGAEINYPRRRHNYQPLHLAVQENNLEIVKCLIDNGATLKSNAKYTPLHLAVIQGNLDIVELLLNHNSDVNERSTDGATPLILAAQSGRENVTRLLLERGACVNDKNQYNQTPIYVALKRRYLKSVIKCLLEYNTQIDDECYKLICDSILHHEDFCAKSLIDYGFKIKQEDMENRDLLSAAVKKGYCEIVQSFFSYGGDLYDKDYKDSLLHAAVKYKQIKVIELLLMSGCDVNAVNSEGYTPLHLALLKSPFRHTRWYPEEYREEIDREEKLETQIFELLLKFGADINHKTKSGCAVLHFAAHNGNKEVTLLLLKLGANAHLPDENGETALDYACRKKRDKIVGILRSKLFEMDAVCMD